MNGYLELSGSAVNSAGAGVAWSGEQALITPEPWMQDARCGETNPEEFFPDRGGSTRQAKKICRGCDVVEECLKYALEHDERFGIWGGTSERERRKLKREATA